MDFVPPLRAERLRFDLPDGGIELFDPVPDRVHVLSAARNLP